MANPSPLPHSLQRRLNTLAHGTDANIEHLLRLFSTPAGTDKILQTLYYSLKLLTPQLTRLRNLRTQRLLNNLVSKASTTLLPGEAVIATLDLSGEATALGVLERSLGSLANLVSDFRIFVRCWGLLGIYAWAKAHYRSPPADALQKWLVWAQVGVNVGFQWYENAAYLASKGVLRGKWCDEKVQTRWWCVSCRFWAAHVALEAVRLLRVRQLAQAAQKEVIEKKVDAETRKTRALEAAAWKRAWYINTAYAPLTIHWSTEQGFLSDEWLGLLGTIAGGIGVTQMWKQTA